MLVKFTLYLLWMLAWAAALWWVTERFFTLSPWLATTEFFLGAFIAETLMRMAREGKQRD